MIHEARLVILTDEFSYIGSCEGIQQYVSLESSKRLYHATYTMSGLFDTFLEVPGV